jgi:hypothetical protein
LRNDAGAQRTTVQVSVVEAGGLPHQRDGPTCHQFDDRQGAGLTTPESFLLHADEVID